MDTGPFDGLCVHRVGIGDHIPPSKHNRKQQREAGRKGGKGNKGKKRGRAKPKDWKPRPYKAKQFIAWDGEGISDDPNRWQNYIVFGNSEGDYLLAHDLRTIECLDFLVSQAEKYPNGTHVIFGMDYDVNMILRDMPKDRVRSLYKNGELWCWKGYHIEYIPKKIFKVWKHKSWGGKGKRFTLSLYDVFTFFSVSFVKALRQYDAVPESIIAEIESGKALRGAFQFDEIHSVVIPYWQKELAALVKLCDALELSLSSAGIDLDSYHGPGAIADFLLAKNHTRHNMPGYIPGKELQYAIQSAYAGGRFEQFRIGHTEQRVYQYDIRSAYPYAISQIPDLRKANWVHYKGFPPIISRWSLYKIRQYTSSELWSPKPFYFRHGTGNIIYPYEIGSGWHYGIELEGALEHNATFDIEEYWELEYDAGSKPFSWVPTLYQQRAEWKRFGNPAEKAAKLGINSLYGKFAQRVGGYSEAPKWHTLEWAGMVTAYTRNQIYLAMMQAPDQLIACETDSVFSLVPLDLPISEELGDWEATEHSEVTYLQSGVYFTRDRQSETKADKFRGLSPGSLSLDRVKAYLANPSEEGIPVSVHRFRTMGTAINLYWQTWPGEWCQWSDLEKVVNPLSIQGKRIHLHCPVCERGSGFLEEMHLLHVNHLVDTRGESAIHKLEWIDGEGHDYEPEDYND